MLSLFFILLPIIMIGAILIIKKDKVTNWKSILCYGVLSTFVSMILASIASAFSFEETLKISKSLIVAIFCFTITAGLPEELSKFIAVKLSKPKGKRQILLTAILVSLVFTVCEDFGYVSTRGTQNAISRFLSGGHFIYQLIMAYFLIKASKSSNSKKTTLNICALAIPTVLHGIYDAIIYLYLNNNKIIAYVIGVIIYIILIYFLYKVEKDEQPEQQTKEKLGVIKLIIGFLGVFIYASLFLFGGGLTNGGVSLGKEQDCKGKFSLKVISSEKNTKEALFGGEKEYTKVKVEIKNNSNEEIDLGTTYVGWSIIKKSGESVSNAMFDTFGDEVKTNIQPEESVTGYVYFETDYNNNEQVKFCYKEEILGESTCYKFNLK